MSRIRAEDRVLFTIKEFDLIQLSFPSVLKSLSRARVKSLITRARKYWDKYRQLSRTQHRDAKTSMGRPSRPDANLRTERKAQLFAETLSRLEKRLTQLDKAERSKRVAKVKPQKRGIPKPPKKSKTVERTVKSKRGSPVTPAGQASPEARAARQLQKSRMRAIQGHIRASGRRRQAKRDQR